MYLLSLSSYVPPGLNEVAKVSIGVSVNQYERIKNVYILELILYSLNILFVFNYIWFKLVAYIPYNCILS